MIILLVKKVYTMNDAEVYKLLKETVTNVKTSKWRFGIGNRMTVFGFITDALKEVQSKASNSEHIKKAENILQQLAPANIVNAVKYQKLGVKLIEDWLTESEN